MPPTASPSKQRNEFHSRHNADDPQLRGVMYALLAEAEAGNPNGRLFVDSLVTALSIHFITQYSVETETIPDTRFGLTRQQFQRTVEYIETHLAENISLETLAKEAGLSKSYFCRLFKTLDRSNPLPVRHTPASGERKSAAQVRQTHHSRHLLWMWFQ